MRSTAMSVAGSAPSTLAENSRRSLSLTVTSLASRTTCALVRISPSLLMMKPEPWPRNGTDGRGAALALLKARHAAEELEERVVLEARRQALLFGRGLVRAGDRDADDRRAGLLDDGAVVGHQAAAVLARVDHRHRRRCIGGCGRSRCVGAGLRLALQPARQVDGTGRACGQHARSDHRGDKRFDRHGSNSFMGNNAEDSACRPR